MSSVDRLKAAITTALAVSLETPPVPKGLHEEIERLRHSLGGAGGERPPRDHLREAVHRFRQTREVGTLGEARLVCFGSAERFAPREAPLIEEPQYFPELLKFVDRYSPEPRSFRRCYRGLLHVYFAYDGDNEATCTAGRHNWRELRTYLGARRTAIHVEGFRPEWVGAIEENENLLTEDPVSRYASKLLDGDREEVDRLKSRLDIQETSWLIRRLILEQIIFATRASDNSFKARTEQLLGLLKDQSVFENEGLALILERYAKIHLPEPNAALRDRAIEVWGNPTFQRHSPEWSRVSETAKKMVSTWATLDIIREFFEVLSEDRQTDQRRLKFWQRYHEQIHDMYFALGTSALHARDSDAQRVRKKMGDHMLLLKRGGRPSNNAFIMLMGDIVVVEFGVKGNACYLYRKSNLPFALRGEVTGDRDGLKSLARLEQLTHMDGSFQTWEDKFEVALAALGIRPGNGPRTQAHRWYTTPPPRATPRSPTPDSAFSRITLDKFAREHALTVSDYTHQGGHLWVVSPKQEGPIADTLESWGFKYSERRRAWWREDW